MRAILILLLAFSHLPMVSAKTLVVTDPASNRAIPVALYFPENPQTCQSAQPCQVALLSAGYGMAHTKYSFLADTLNQAGFMVIAIRHELPGDPPLSVTGNLYETRRENWQRGANTLKFIRSTLQGQFPDYDFERLTLVGHSNGGDISAWFANEDKRYIRRIITLDHRRVPLPKTQDIEVLSIRASDFPADAGVLPSVAERKRFGSCVVQIANARHNDMSDDGPQWLKDKIQRLLSSYLAEQPCARLSVL